jgi:hypothetical protein
MKKLMLAVAAVAAGSFGAVAAVAEDLEVLDAQIAQTVAQVLVEAAEKLEKVQVKIEGDLEKSCGVHRERTGILLVPQKDIKPETEAVNSDPGAPLAHMFMSEGFTLVLDGKPVDAAKLRTLTVQGPDGNDMKAAYLLLAARHLDDDTWHLYGYGTDDKPLLDVAIGEGSGPGTEPLALEVKEFDDNAGTAYVTIFDRFQSNFKVSYKEPAQN